MNKAKLLYHCSGDSVAVTYNCINIGIDYKACNSQGCLGVRIHGHAYVPHEPMNNSLKSPKATPKVGVPLSSFV